MQKEILSGVLLLDKPQGLSSHDALFKAKKALMTPSLDTKKAGHTGTLDPMATGLLPICFGVATKFASFALDADKGYTALILLGAQTDTGDQEGCIIDTLPVPTLSQAMLDDVARNFLGEQHQIPPMYSALKKDGKKLYEYARDGILLERDARPIHITDLSLQLTDTPNIIKLTVVCSKGTYVRVLGEDIAKALGTVGHLVALRRTMTGGFDIAQAVTLDNLSPNAILPVDSLLAHLPILPLTNEEIARLRLGQRLNVKDRANKIAFADNDTSALVRLYEANTQQGFVGLGEVARTGRLQPKGMI